MSAANSFEREVNIEAMNRLIEVYSDCPDIEQKMLGCGGAGVSFVAMRATVLYELREFQQELDASGLALTF